MTYESFITKVLELDSSLTRGKCKRLMLGLFIECMSIFTGMLSLCIIFIPNNMYLSCLLFIGIVFLYTTLLAFISESKETLSKFLKLSRVWVLFLVISVASICYATLIYKGV